MEMTSMYLDFWEVGDVDILTPTGTYSCRCTELTTSIFTVECGLLFLYLGDKNLTAEELLWETPRANIEQMTFEAQQEGNETVFVPTRGFWREGINGDEYELGGESFVFSNSSLEIASCEAYDAFCEDAFDCQVCPGGQSISWSNCYNEATCEEGANALFIHQIILDDGITIVPYQELDEAEDSTCQTVENFCADQASIEETITDSLSNFLAEDGGQVVEPFNCSCTEITQDHVALDCDAQYTYDEVELLVNTEHMTFKRQEGTAYYLPERVQFTDQLIEDIGTSAPPYNESFVLDVGLKDVVSCNINGCEAYHCQVCPGETTVLNSCPGSPHSCESAFLIPFLFQFRNIKLALEGCDAASTPAVNKAG
ncbi:hypothetical protein SEMRO_2760_G336420.1 [Seminavis robusta]|uniref:Uncharacterized protein n=1 Tax=Seminavis robusta TaxID=568900 RepID=A0A9N8HWR3_9STRA|nr:hypothetical protein SEMRO_2760_G336420.1 [Seminavis robusta]|eukprot:Sro2760_g336420.1 n/a (369) ;mRNA; r:4213-5319